ncbi:MAG: hypothetical protein IJ368_00365 [Oscillospiraceae bacterium]|nr:hypothetical protein [Oscillospiraceae bacterium]
MNIQYDVDGYGVQGVITPQFSFSVPAYEYSDTSGLFPVGAAVRLTCSNGMEIPCFYISERRYSGSKLNFICYDRTYTTERSVIVSDDNFDSDGYIPISSVMEKIIAVCGFSGYSDGSGMIGSIITKAHKDDIVGQSCRTVLDDLSRACAGCWTVQSDTGDEVSGILTLIPLGNSSMGAIFTAEKHETVYIGGQRTFSQISVSNGSNIFSAGTTSTAYGLLAIETSYASNEVAAALYNRLHDYSYTAWECGKMLTDIIPVPSSLVTMGAHSNMYINHCNISLVSTGVYATVGRNAVTEDELAYHNRTMRELMQRYRIGDLMGNTKISKNGLKIVFKDKVNNKTEEYGFTSTESGVTYYDGTIIDKTMPDFIETVSDTIKRIGYGNSVYRLSYEFDENGRKTNISFEKEEKEE